MKPAHWLLAAVPAAATLLLLPFRSRKPEAAPLRRDLPFSYTNVAGKAGIRFRHDDCRSGTATMMEQAGPGCAILDFDGDGWLDLYLLNGRDRYGRGILRENALYRNNRDGTFTDVTREARVPGTGYGLGAAAGDFDNDGDPDLYVCQYGPNVLYRNNGDGTFADATRAAGVHGMELGEPFHTGAAWLDYDRDGDLDLFVGGYVRFRSGPRLCTIPGTEIRSNCPPSEYQGTHCLLYRNDGGGRFTNVTDRARARLPGSKALTCISVDVNRDGWPDLYVGNDGTPAWLLRNNRDGTFSEAGESTGIARTQDGGTMAAMGLDFGDVWNDGTLALFVADFQEVPSHLFHEVNGVFMEVSDRAGIARPTVNTLGFGAGFLDCDADGWLDLFLANGHVYPEIDLARSGVTYRQSPQLFRNERDGTFREVSAEAGPAFRERQASRGAAWGDLWNRGAQDILVANNTDPPSLLRHEPPPARSFLSLKLVGTKSNRDAIGARVFVTAGGITQSREVRTSCSYLSSIDPRLHFGLGGATVVEKLEIRWPLGRRDVFAGVEPGRFYLCTEGAGRLAEQPIVR